MPYVHSTNIIRTLPVLNQVYLADLLLMRDAQGGTRCDSKSTTTDTVHEFYLLPVPRLSTTEDGALGTARSAITIYGVRSI